MACSSSALCGRNSFRGVSRKKLLFHCARPRVPHGATGIIIPIPQVKIQHALLERHELVNLQPLVCIKKEFLLHGCLVIRRKSRAMRANHAADRRVSFRLQKGGAGRLMCERGKTSTQIFPCPYSVATVAKIHEAQEIMKFTRSHEEERAGEDAALEHCSRELFRICPHSIAMTANVHGKADGLSPGEHLFPIGESGIVKSHRKRAVERIIFVKENVNRVAILRAGGPSTFGPFNAADARMRGGRREHSARVAFGQAVQIDMEKLAMPRRSIALLYGKCWTLDMRQNTEPLRETTKKRRFAGAHCAAEEDCKGSGVESAREGFSC